MSRSWAVVVFLLCLAGQVGLPVAAEESERLAAGHRLRMRGRYEEAIERFQELAADGEVAVKATVEWSRAEQDRGQWEQAQKVVAQALKQLGPHADLLARRAELALQRGEPGVAAKLARQALKLQHGHLLARWIDACAADAAGSYDQALQQYRWFVEYYNDHQVQDAASLVLIGRAVTRYAERALRDADQAAQLNLVLNDLYDRATAIEPDYWPALYRSGLLFLSKYRKGDALSDLNRALAINGRAAPVHCALGLVAFQQQKLEQAARHCRRALAIDARLPAARRLQARLLMAQERFAEALAEWEQARKLNPADQRTLAGLAACHLFLGHDEQGRQIERLVRQRNPRPVVFYCRLAEELENQRRFELAARYFRQAIAADPKRARPHFGLGTLYMRVGQEQQAAEELETAFRADPFNVRTKNMLEVLDQLAGYQTIQTEHFRIKLDGKLDGLLGRYVGQYLEQAYEELGRRFGFRPAERIQVEIFNRGRGQSAHQWFSARTVGLPWIGTVGACTGKVVAMASPTGLGKPLNWARVLKHELSHVFTLQQTRYRIPHWFTEALAVRVEGYPRPPQWNQLLAQRVPAGQMWNLDNINGAFARPKNQADWQMAYCQSELYADYMEQRKGPESIAAMLAAYADGLSTAQAIRRVFQVDLQQFEAGYVEFVKGVVRSLPVDPAETTTGGLLEAQEAYRQQPDSPDRAAELAWQYLRRRAYPTARRLADQARQRQANHPLACYVLAKLHLVIGDADAALQVLEPALDQKRPDGRVLALLADLYTRNGRSADADRLYELAHHRYPAAPRWLAGLARSALLRGDRPALQAALEKLTELKPDDPAPPKKLATMALEDKDWPRAIRYAWSTLHVDVADVEAHWILAEAYAGTGQWAKAADEYTLVHQLDPQRPGLPLKLATALSKIDRTAEAVKLLEQLLQQEPDNAAARSLLHKLTR